MAFGVASSSLCRHLPVPPPCLMNIYSPILARNILRKTPRSIHRFYSSTSIPQTHTTTLPRPYTFHIGTSWAGKSANDTQMIKTAFPLDTLIGTWRDKTLSRPKAVRSVDAGEDFFFVQEVIMFILRDFNPLILISFLCNRCGIDQ